MWSEWWAVKSEEVSSNEWAVKSVDIEVSSEDRAVKSEEWEMSDTKAGKNIENRTLNFSVNHSYNWDFFFT